MILRCRGDKGSYFLKLIEFQTRKFLMPALRYANSVGWFLNEEESFKPWCPDYMFFQITFTHEYLHARVCLSIQDSPADYLIDFILPIPDLTSYWYLQKQLHRGQSEPWLGLTIQISTYRSLANKRDRKRLTLRLYFLVKTKFSDLNFSVKHLLRFHADFDYLDQNVCVRYTVKLKLAASILTLSCR